MHEFLERIEAAIQQQQLLAAGQKILVAVSGGVDSMVLLHSLHLLARANHWEMAVAHFNHRLRGRGSDADEQLVATAAARLHLKFFRGGAEVKRIAEQSKISIEMASRKLRHEFLARTAREQNIPTIALAHHADDQVELFFVRLLRGAGGEGLAGMKRLSPSPADKALTLIRPLLNFSKGELMEFAREKKIQYRNDATNFSVDFLRNRIRNELLPLLREDYQPGLDKTVLRLMEIVGAEAEFVRDAARKFCAGLAAPAGPGTGEEPAGGENGGARAGGRFDELPLALQRKVLQQQLAGAGLVPDFELVEQLRNAAGKKISVAAGFCVWRDDGGLVTCCEEAAEGFSSEGIKFKLAGKAGRGEFGAHRFRWRVEPMKHFQRPRKKNTAAAALREFFDADKIGNEIFLRYWQPGDRFQPIGLSSAVKLQDLFVNAKIPFARRRQLVLAATKSGEIFWVEGLRIGEHFKLTPATSRKLVWQPKVLKKEAGQPSASKAGKFETADA